MKSKTIRVSMESYEVLLQLAAEMTISSQGRQKHTVADALDALIETQLDAKARREIMDLETEDTV